MIEVTSKEFRNRQASLLNLADQGEEVIIKRRGKTSYVLTPVKENRVSEPDGFELSAELEEDIQKSLEDIKKGRYISFKTAEEAMKYLEEL